MIWKCLGSRVAGHHTFWGRWNTASGAVGHPDLVYNCNLQRNITSGVADHYFHLGLGEDHFRGHCTIISIWIAARISASPGVAPAFWEDYFLSAPHVLFVREGEELIGCHVRVLVYRFSSWVTKLIVDVLIILEMQKRVLMRLASLQHNPVFNCLFNRALCNQHHAKCGMCLRRKVRGSILLSDSYQFRSEKPTAKAGAVVFSVRTEVVSYRVRLSRIDVKVRPARIPTHVCDDSQSAF